MADSEFQVEAIGAVFAQALVNEAQKQGVLDAVTEDVRGIGQLIKGNASFRAFMEALTIGEEERVKSLEKIFGNRIHPLTLNVLLAMSRRDRFMFLGGLVEAFEKILRKMSGHVDVELISATEVSPAVLERVKAAMGTKLGKIADIKVKVDRELIGGMMLRIGDTLIDGSVATQLEKMEDQLKKKGVPASAAAG